MFLECSSFKISGFRDFGNSIFRNFEIFGISELWKIVNLECASFKNSRFRDFIISEFRDFEIFGFGNSVFSKVRGFGLLENPKSWIS